MGWNQIKKKQKDRIESAVEWAAHVTAAPVAVMTLPGAGRSWHPPVHCFWSLYVFLCRSMPLYGDIPL